MCEGFFLMRWNTTMTILIRNTHTQIIIRTRHLITTVVNKSKSLTKSRDLAHHIISLFHSQLGEEAISTISMILGTKSKRDSNLYFASPIKACSVEGQCLFEEIQQSFGFGQVGNQVERTAPNWNETALGRNELHSVQAKLWIALNSKHCFSNSNVLNSFVSFHFPRHESIGWHSLVVPTFSNLLVGTECWTLTLFYLVFHLLISIFKVPAKSLKCPLAEEMFLLNNI